MSRANRTRKSHGVRNAPHGHGLRGWQLTFATPMFIALLATTILPFVYSVGLSVSSANTTLRLEGPATIAHYRSVLGSGALWNSMLLAVVFLAVALVVELVLGVVTAIVFDRIAPNANWLRVLLLWPVVLPPIAVALVFRYILQGDIGMVSYYLAQMGVRQQWLTEPGSAMAVIVAVDVWQYTPFVILLTMAALKTMPTEVLEAAQIDGAGDVRTVLNIILPILKPALISIALLRFIDAVQVFPTIYILTRGGPGTSTQLLAYFNFQVFFGQLRFAEGAAITVIVVLFTLASVAAFVQFQRRAEKFA